MPNHRLRALLWAALAAARPALAQAPLLPEAGGHIVSLGQPPLWHWRAGLGFGQYRGTLNDLMVRAEVGVYHAPLNPVIGLAELGLEGYVGARGDKPDGGLRALLQIPYLSAGAGADYNLRDERLDFLVTLHTPVRRGGLLSPGSLLRLDWYPLNRHSFTLGIMMPLGDARAGRRRPVDDRVSVLEARAAPTRRSAPDPALEPVLDSLRASAEWIRRLVVPFLDQDGRDGGVAMERTARYVDELRARLLVRGVDDEVRFFHAQLERLFRVAGGDDEAGREIARRCRAIVLDDILLPYDGLLGRKKSHDSMNGLAVAARGHFSRWLTTSRIVPEGRADAVLSAFERLTEIFEAERRIAAAEWDDPRLVWLPLQYALLPEQHDRQDELDGLLERATGERFTEHNRLTYAANLQFHWELLDMIRDTRSYHVLWIHDFPASTDGRRLDAASFRVACAYLSALADRVLAYDSAGTLPLFFIFLDQHYYEERSSRVLMSLLEDPLDASPDLPLLRRQDADTLSRVLVRLRRAVASSRVLQAEAREYGADWLKNRIKVHVNITNRPDPTFWAGGLVATLFSHPDDVMRDHRKIAFRDVSDDDPASGEAVVTGMGAGRQYLGPGWDDRSLIVRGPALRELRQGARELLLSQGMTETELPPPLRGSFTPRAADGRAGSPDLGDTRALTLINGTGYLPKPINVAKALLYSLMPSGSVLKIPDSMWNATLFAGLLVGASLRGSHVLIVAPSQANTSGDNFALRARTHELLSRLVLARRALEARIHAAGGELRVGLYALPPDERRFASRAERWTQEMDTTPFLRALLPGSDAVLPVVRAAAARTPDDSCAEEAPREPPKLHQKTQYLATRDFWDAVVAAPDWPAFMATYLAYREATYCSEPERAEGRVLADSLNRIAALVLREAHPPQGAASFAMVGSQNQDNRGILMDGEVGILFTGATSLVPLVDLVFMAGTVTWLEDQATLDRLITPPNELERRIGRASKDGL